MNTMMKQTDLFEKCEYKPNNIYNENCYQAIKKLPDNSIDLVYIDIPYIIESGGASPSPLSQRAKRLRNVDLADLKEGIDYSLFDELCRVMKKIYIYIWCSKAQLTDIMYYFEKKKNCRMNLLVWCKTNPTPLGFDTWLPDLEYCLVFKEKGAKRYNAGYDVKSKWYMSGINQKDKKLFNHPTVKPLELVKRHLLHSTEENDVVLDCFLGSGTTAIACKELGRKYIGFEIDENYFNIAQDRLNGISQKDRKDQENGISNLYDFMGE